MEWTNGERRGDALRAGIYGDAAGRVTSCGHMQEAHSGTNVHEDAPCARIARPRQPHGVAHAFWCRAGVACRSNRSPAAGTLRQRAVASATNSPGSKPDTPAAPQTRGGGTRRRQLPTRGGAAAGSPTPAQRLAGAAWPWTAAPPHLDAPSLTPRGRPRWRAGRPYRRRASSRASVRASLAPQNRPARTRSKKSDVCAHPPRLRPRRCRAKQISRTCWWERGETARFVGRVRRLHLRFHWRSTKGGRGGGGGGGVAQPPAGGAPAVATTAPPPRRSRYAAE
jgi:hypothetical protein